MIEPYIETKLASRLHVINFRVTIVIKLVVYRRSTNFGKKSSLPDNKRPKDIYCYLNHMLSFVLLLMNK